MLVNKLSRSLLTGANARQPDLVHDHFSLMGSLCICWLSQLCRPLYILAAYIFLQHFLCVSAVRSSKSLLYSFTFIIGPCTIFILQWWMSTTCETSDEVRVSVTWTSYCMHFVQFTEKPWTKVVVHSLKTLTCCMSRFFTLQYLVLYFWVVHVFLFFFSKYSIFEM